MLYQYPTSDKLIIDFKILLLTSVYLINLNDAIPRKETQTLVFHSFLYQEVTNRNYTIIYNHVSNIWCKIQVMKS